MSSTDPYEVLGLPSDATEDEIRRRYRTLAMQYHPDRQRGDTTARMDVPPSAGGVRGNRKRGKGAGFPIGAAAGPRRRAPGAPTDGAGGRAGGLDTSR